MTRVKPGIIGVAVILLIVATWLFHRRTQDRLLDQIQTLRLKTDGLDSLRAENARLSNRLAQIDPVEKMSPEESTELLRLRGEVGQLHQEVTLLKNRQAEGRQQEAESAKEKTEADASKWTDLEMKLPKASWAFAGY